MTEAQANIFPGDIVQLKTENVAVGVDVVDLEVLEIHATKRPPSVVVKAAGDLSLEPRTASYDAALLAFVRPGPRTPAQMGLEAPDAPAPAEPPPTPGYTFALGDVVELRSGSHVMTVARLFADDQSVDVVYADNDQICRTNIAVAALLLAAIDDEDRDEDDGVTTLEKELAMANVTIKHLKDDIAFLNVTIDSKAVEIAALHQAINDAEGQTIMLQGRLDAAQAELASHHIVNTLGNRAPSILPPSPPAIARAFTGPEAPGPAAPAPEMQPIIREPLE